MNESAFNVLVKLLEPPSQSRTRIASNIGLSAEEFDRQLAALEVKGYIDEQMRVTDAGLDALEPYRVRNAVIMAAGMSTRFAPLSYERPKGTLRVKGDVLIERQIRQLHKAGVNDIIVVVGYKKEEFFYLKDSFGVKIVVNEDYAARNNNSTIKVIERELGNTYICSSDNYFQESPFEPYVYDSYYAAIYHEGPTDEYCLKIDERNESITGIDIGGSDSWIMLGHAYWSDAFASRFREILDAVYEEPATYGKLWEDIYAEHIASLPMRIKRYEADMIWEFDSLDELRDFDPHFIENVDSNILENICLALHCDRKELAHFDPIKQGLTNLSVRFDLRGKTYVYRHPGPGTEKIVNRKSEAHSQSIARNLGIDRTFIYEDPEFGWKVSEFIANCVPFDYRNRQHVCEAMRLIRTLHNASASSPWTFDAFRKAEEIIELLEPVSFKGFDELRKTSAFLSEAVKADGVKPVLCHNDFYSPNLLVHEDGMDLIDWEYSAMADYASDLGTFICCSDYGLEEAEAVIWEYFQREPTPKELRHCMAYVSLCAFYWFVWALYKDRAGHPVGEWLYLWYRMAKDAGSHAKTLYAL